MQIIDINNQIRECQEILIDPKWPGFVTAKFVSQNNPARQHVEWYPIKEFVEKNPEVSKTLGNISSPQEDLGIVTHSGEFYLEDTSKSWQNNIFVGLYAWISRGTGEGQVRLIKSNSKNTITIDPAWEVLPDTKSQYVISFNIHDVKILGNTLPQFQS